MHHRSHLTARERDARSRMARIVHQEPFLCGSLVSMNRVCGKPHCKCARGERHPALCLSIRVRGKRKMIHIPKPWETTIRAWVGNYRDLKRLMDRVSDGSLNRFLKEKHSAPSALSEGGTRR